MISVIMPVGAVGMVELVWTVGTVVVVVKKVVALAVRMPFVEDWKGVGVVVLARILSGELLIPSGVLVLAFMMRLLSMMILVALIFLIVLNREMKVLMIQIFLRCLSWMMMNPIATETRRLVIGYAMGFLLRPSSLSEK